MIQSIWQIDRITFSLREQIIPKGVVEIIYNFSEGSHISATVGNKKYELGNCFVNGFNRLPLHLDLPTRQIFLGIRLQPLAAKKILGLPSSEFADQLVDLSLVDKKFKSIWLQLAEEKEFNKRVSIIYRWIEDSYFEWNAQERLMNEFLSGTAMNDMSVSELAGTLCYSSRHLSRKLFEVTRMNAEEILLYKKYLQSVNLMHDSALSLTQVAYGSGFSDQSHFIRSFRMYSGLTPGEYRKGRSFVKGHLLSEG